MGKYQNSIEEIYKYRKDDKEQFGGKLWFSDYDYIRLACNYVKLKDFEKAKEYLDKVKRGCYIINYVDANYYEVIGDKDKALQYYNKIKKQKFSDAYCYYQDALKRIEELNKPNPKLLTELFYPSSRPDDNGRCE